MATTEEAVRQEQEDWEREHPGETREEGGRSIEDEARARVDGTSEEQPDDDGTPQLVLPGTGSRLSSSVGGRRPTESLFKLTGTSLPIAGNQQVEKDSEVWVAIRVAVDDVRVHNRRKDGEIVAVRRTHTAKPIAPPVILDFDPTGGVPPEA